MPYKFPGSALLGTRLANGRNRKLIRMDGRQPGAVWLHGWDCREYRARPWMRPWSAAPCSPNEVTDRSLRQSAVDSEEQGAAAVSGFARPADAYNRDHSVLTSVLLFNVKSLVGRTEASAATRLGCSARSRISGRPAAAPETAGAGTCLLQRRSVFARPGSPRYQQRRPSISRHAQWPRSCPPTALHSITSPLFSKSRAMPSDRSSSVGTLLVHSVSFAFDSFSKSKMLPRAEASAAVRSASSARTVAKSRAKPCERSRSASSFVVQSFSFVANRWVSCSISLRAEATAVMLSASSARTAARLPLSEPRSAVSLVVHSFSLASNRFVSCAISFRAEASAVIRSASSDRTAAKSRAIPSERSRSASSAPVDIISLSLSHFSKYAISLRADASAAIDLASSARTADKSDGVSAGWFDFSSSPPNIFSGPSTGLKALFLSAPTSSAKSLSLRQLKNFSFNE